MILQELVTSDATPVPQSSPFKPAISPKPRSRPVSSSHVSHVTHPVTEPAKPPVTHTVTQPVIQPVLNTAMHGPLPMLNTAREQNHFGSLLLIFFIFL